MKVQLEFAGGLELLFDNQKSMQVTLPNTVCNIRELIIWTKDNQLKERPDLFIQGGSVRPGILVLVNDTDWEILGGLEYKLNEGDKIVFISTLHGG